MSVKYKMIGSSYMDIHNIYHLLMSTDKLNEVFFFISKAQDFIYTWSVTKKNITDLKK